MPKSKKRPEDALPEWLEHALKDVPPVTNEERARFNHMKEDFFAALDRAAPFREKARKGSVTGAARTVFSLAGRLIEAAQDAICFTPALAPAAVTRSVIKEKDLPSPPHPISVIAFPYEDVCIELAHYRQGMTTLLSVNLRERESGREIRPITVRITDREGNDLVPPQDVAATDLPPGFPDPRPGDYIVHVTWKDRQVSAEISYQE